MKDDKDKQDELILPGSHSIPERMRQFRAAGFKEDGKGNMVNPNLDPNSAEAQKVAKRLYPKGNVKPQPA